jgi:transposase
MELLPALLPQTPLLHLETWQIDTTPAQVTLRVQSTQTRVPCPVCQCPARRIQSHYRRTQRLLHWLAHIAVALGGAAGVQLSRGLDVAVSRRTLLRVLRRLPLPSVASPTVLGVDDFAMRKRQRYGTVLIDLERRQPVALLPERTAETLAPGLREHPGIQVIVRDRSPAYAEGARQGAPAAIQVADRFHLLQNLREALDQVFITHSHVLDAVNETLRQRPVPLTEGAMAVPVPAHDIPLPAQPRAAPRQARRQALHAQVWALHRQGWTAPAIVQQVGVSLHTVQRDLRRATFAGRTRRRDLGDSVLNPYKAYLLERWNAGCHTAMQLVRERRQRGYGGSYALVAAYARRLRQVQGLPPGHRRPRQPLPHVAEPSCPLLTPRRVTWLVLRHEAKRTVAEAIDLAQDFVTLVRQRQPMQLDPWLTRATTSPLEALRRFATGLYEDYEAVKAGVSLPWSTSPVEGHINRLNMLKRQMFGRAHLDLLRRRFVRAFGGGQGEALSGALAA